MHHHHPFHQSPSDKNHEGNTDTARESLEGSDIKVKERKGMFWEWRRGKQSASKSVQEIQYLRPKQTLSSLNKLGESGKIKMEHNHFIVTAFLELCVDRICNWCSMAQSSVYSPKAFALSWSSSLSHHLHVYSQVPHISATYCNNRNQETQSWMSWTWLSDCSLIWKLLVMCE